MTAVVLDNSAAILLSTRATLDNDGTQYYAPEIIDLEYASALRKLVLRGALDAAEAGSYVAEWSANVLIRCNHTMLLSRIWELRNNITPYDAAYVALAEVLGIPLMTADQRLAKAASDYCGVIAVGD